VQAQLRDNAEVTLHAVRACAAQGAEDGIVWHRGTTHEQERQIEAEGVLEETDDGAQVWDYFLFYRPRDPAGFEVLAVRSCAQVARWEQMYRAIGDAARPVLRSA
jgi:hypothetical protein